MEEDVVVEGVLKTFKVQVAEVITPLKTAKGTPKVEASLISEEVVLEVAINHAYEVVVEKE